MIRKAIAPLLILAMVLFISCNESDPVSSDLTSVSISGMVLPAGIVPTVKATQGDLTKSTTCDSTGAFEIQGLYPGTCVLEVTATTYGKYTRSVTLTEGGVNQLTDIVLGSFPYPVRSVSPSLGSEWNSLSATISLGFLLPMDTAVTNAALGITPSTAGTITWSSNATYLTYRPKDKLASGTHYSVVLDTSARTSDGKSLEFPLAYSFTTEPLRVTNSNPSDGATEVGLTQTAYIYFNVQPNTATLEQALSVTPPTALEIRWSGTTLYLSPASGYWLADTTYTIGVADSAKDKNGNSILWSFTSSFSTQEARITSVTPADNDEGVSISTLIYMYFNTKPDRTVLASAFSLKDSSGASVAGNFRWYNTYFYFNPLENLNTYARYTVTLDSTARGADGSIISDTSFSFLTASSSGGSNRLGTINPNTGTLNYGLSNSPYIRFDRTVVDTSAEAHISITPAVNLDLSWSSNYLYIAPQSGYWQGSTTYTLVLSDSVLETNGEFSTDSLVTVFTTMAAGISSFNPKQGQTNVSMGSGLNINFLSGMDQSLTQQAVTLQDANDSLIAGVATWSSNGTYLTFRPSQPLRPSTVYAFGLAGSAADAHGAVVTGDTIQFTTEAVRVTYSNPANGMSNVPQTQQIYFNFNTATNGALVEQAFSISPAIELTNYWSASYLYFKPRNLYWKSSTWYTVTVDTSAQDAWGTAFENPISYTFKVQDVEVNSQSPDHMEREVSTGTAITVGFNTAMDSTSVASALQCLKSSDSTAVSGTTTGATTSWTFTPDAALETQTSYIVRVDTAATDAFGVALPGEWTTTFTTGN